MLFNQIILVNSRPKYFIEHAKKSNNEEEMIHHSLCNDGRNQREKEDRVWKKLFLWGREPSSSSPISAPTSNPIIKFQIEISKTLRKQSFEIFFSLYKSTPQRKRKKRRDRSTKRVRCTKWNLGEKQKLQRCSLMTTKGLGGDEREVEEGRREDATY